MISLTQPSKGLLRHLLEKAATACALILAAWPALANPLTPEPSIPLARVTGRLGHLAVDVQRGRLFVAEPGNNTVDTIDIASGKPVHRIKSLREPQSVGYSASADILAVAGAIDGSVKFFKGEALVPAGSVELGDSADIIRADNDGNFLIGYGHGFIAIVNPATRSVLSRLPIAAHPDGFAPDPSGSRLFINAGAKAEIAVIDPSTGRLSASWHVPGHAANVPMALDPGTGTLAIGFRNPPRLTFLDAAGGAVEADLPTCTGADDISFDSTRQRAYLSCGSGSIDVAERVDGAWHDLARLDTRQGAGTSLFVPRFDRLFVAEPASYLGFGGNAAILVFKAGK